MVTSTICYKFFLVDAFKIVQNLHPYCSAGSPCPIYCLNFGYIGGARRPGECHKRIHTVDLALQCLVVFSVKLTLLVQELFTSDNILTLVEYILDKESR